MLGRNKEKGFVKTLMNKNLRILTVLQ